MYSNKSSKLPSPHQKPFLNDMSNHVTFSRSLNSCHFSFPNGSLISSLLSPEYSRSSGSSFYIFVQCLFVSAGLSGKSHSGLRHKSRVPRHNELNPIKSTAGRFKVGYNIKNVYIKKLNLPKTMVSFPIKIFEV